MLGGLKTPVYHITNVVIHSLVACMAYALAWLLLRRPLAHWRVGDERDGDAWGLSPSARTLSLQAAGAALLFGLHPVHSECVANITSRADPMAAFFCLAAAIVYLWGRSPEGIYQPIARAWVRAARSAAAARAGAAAAGAAAGELAAPAPLLHASVGSGSPRRRPKAPCCCYALCHALGQLLIASSQWGAAFLLVLAGLMCKETSLAMPALLVLCDLGMALPAAARLAHLSRHLSAVAACLDAPEQGAGAAAAAGAPPSPPLSRARSSGLTCATCATCLPQLLCGCAAPCTSSSAGGCCAVLRSWLVAGFTAMPILRSLMSCAAGGLIYYLRIVKMSNGYSLQSFANEMHNPLANIKDAFTRRMGKAFVQSWAMTKLVFPVWLSHEHNAHQPVMSVRDGRNLLTLCVAGAMLAVLGWAFFSILFYGGGPSGSCAAAALPQQLPAAAGGGESSEEEGEALGAGEAKAEEGEGTSSDEEFDAQLREQGSSSAGSGSSPPPPPQRTVRFSLTRAPSSASARSRTPLPAALPSPSPPPLASAPPPPPTPAPALLLYPLEHPSDLSTLYLAVRVLTFFGWVIVAYAPSSHAFLYVAFVLAERTLFMPSFGAAMLLSDALGWLAGAAAAGSGALSPPQPAPAPAPAPSPPRPRARARPCLSFSLFAALAAYYSARVWMRNVDWATEENLLRSNLAIYPEHNGMTQYGMGAIKLYQQKFDEAEALLQRALVETTLAEPHILLSQLYWKHKNNYSAAITQLEAIEHTTSPRKEVMQNLGLLLMATGLAPTSNISQRTRAEYLILLGHKAHGYPMGHPNIGLLASNAACIRVLSEPVRYASPADAEALFAEALTFRHSSRVTAFKNQALFYASMGQPAKARAVCEAAIAYIVELRDRADQPAEGKRQAEDFINNFRVLLLSLDIHAPRMEAWAEQGLVAGQAADDRLAYLGGDCSMELVYW